MNIYFTGFMATGKSRIGEATARIMGKTFVDTDKWIESKEGRTVAEIFAQEGEAYFRKLELEAVEVLSEGGNKVVSLGGGTLTQDAVLPIIRAQGILIRLWAPVEVLSERIGRKNTRPLLANLSDEDRIEKIRDMLKQRECYYSLADISVKSCEDTSIEQLARKIKHMVEAWAYRKVEVHHAEGRYPIFIGTDIGNYFGKVIEALGLDTEYLLVTDQNVYNAQREKIKEIQRQVGACRLFRFPAGEKFKTPQTLNRLYTYMLRKGYSRKTTLLQFSGGVVGDMAGFGAATYQRGVPFVQIPTTLLSMVDSSVGGKVAVNHPLGKNMIGAFYQPKCVFIDMKVLETLSDEEYLSGLAEVVKYGVIWDREFFDFLNANVEGILKREAHLLEKIVARSCEIKAKVVSQDEKESGIRAILNYGHTFGHAIEKLTQYEVYSHGIAVSLGMRVAGKLSTLLGLWSDEDERRQTHLLNAFGFPTSYKVDLNGAWSAMGIDKKADKGNRVFVLPHSIGNVKIHKNIPKDKIDLAWQVIMD